MVIIGILGGIASGKTWIADQFVRFGAAKIDADRVGHEVLGDSDVRESLVDRWGSKVIGRDGQLDRHAVAEIVFGPAPDGPRELAFLESITHPRIGRRIVQQTEAMRADGIPMVVIDAAVLIKAGWSSFCDKILFVEANRGLRLQRARQRGWDEKEFAAREAAQESLDEKRKLADWVIDNGQSSEHAIAQVEQVWQTVGGLPARSTQK